MARNVVKKDEQKVLRKVHLIPKGELKCVWMMAGVVSYKLCNYHYECENCPFDQVLRKSSEFVASDEIPVADSDFRTISPDETSPDSQIDGVEGIDLNKFFENFYDIRIKKNLFYHRKHTWLDITDPNYVKIGIDNFAGKFILGIKMVVLPTLKNKINQGQICCWIVGEDETLPILAPLTGYVVSLNPQIVDEPTLVNRSPYEDGWLMRIKPANLQQDIKNVYNDNDVFGLYKGDTEKLKEKFESILKKNWKKLGPTSCDGGNMYIHVRDMIGPKKYSEIINTFFTDK